MISIAYHADIAEVQPDPALAALWEQAGAPFDRPEWWRGLARDCGLEPVLTLARDGNGGVALLPLARAEGGLSALANWYSFHWRPLVSPGADGEALLTALARDLARNSEHRAGRITLSPMPDEDGSASLTARAFRRAGWHVAREQVDSNHVLPVDGRNYTTYLASRPGALRATLKRKAARLDCAVHTGFSDELWAQYEAIYRESWKPAEGSPAFLSHFARAEAEAGRLRLGLARAQGRIVAAQFWTVEAGTAFIHKLAHRPDAEALSPGTVLTGALMAHVLDRDRVALVDFGTGDDAYKRDWMEQVRPRWRLTLRHPRHLRQWPGIARDVLRPKNR